MSTTLPHPTLLGCHRPFWRHSLALVIWLLTAAAPAAAQATQVAELLGSKSATDKIPIGCVHVQVESKVVGKGSVWCADCQAEVWRFQEESRRPGSIAGTPPRLCGRCPQPAVLETQWRHSQQHMADVATLGDVAASVAWLANCEQWDTAATPMVLTHLEFLCHVPTQVLQPMLTAAIQSVERRMRTAPALARMVTCCAERDPTLLGAREAFVLNNLPALAIELRWACLDDLGRGGMLAWAAAPRLLEYFQVLARTEPQVPSEVPLALAAMESIRASDRSHRELERPDRVPSVAALELAPHRLPWEGSVSAVPAGRAAPAQAPAPVVADILETQQRIKEAKSRGDTFEQLRLQTRATYQALRLQLQQKPDLLADPKLLDMLAAQLPLPLAPELRDRWSIVQFERMREQARGIPAAVRDSQSRGSRRGAVVGTQDAPWQKLSEQLVACLDAYAKGNAVDGARTADSIWRWVMQDDEGLEAVHVDAKDAPEGTAVDREMDWHAFDRVILLPSCVMEFAGGFERRGGRRSGKYDTNFLSQYARLDTGGLATQDKAVFQGILAFVTALMQDQDVLIQAEESIAEIQERIKVSPPDAPRLDRDLATTKKLAERLRAPLTNNAARQKPGLPEVFPVDLLGSGLITNDWLAALDKAIVQQAEQAGGKRVDLRPRANAQYLSLRRVRLLLHWGDFAMAQAVLDELWLEHLRP